MRIKEKEYKESSTKKVASYLVQFLGDQLNIQEEQTEKTNTKIKKACKNLTKY